MICSMALKMGLKGILILEIYDILLQIATRTVDREQNTKEQSMNASRDARRESRTVLEVFWKNKKKIKKYFKTSVIVSAFVF